MDQLETPIATLFYNVRRNTPINFIETRYRIRTVVNNIPIVNKEIITNTRPIDTWLQMYLTRKLDIENFKIIVIVF